MRTKQSSGLFRMQNYLSWISYGILALVICLVQMSPRFFPAVAFARPTPLVLFAVCVAMFEGPATGAILSMVAGLFWDLYSSRIFGYHGLLLLLIGLSVSLLVQWLLRTNFLSAMLLCASGVAVYTLLDWLLCHVLFLHEEMGMILLRVYFPDAVYTILLAPLMYYVILWIARMLRRRKNK